jgi:hypothetical protein
VEFSSYGSRACEPGPANSTTTHRLRLGGPDSGHSKRSLRSIPAPTLNRSTVHRFLCASFLVSNCRRQTDSLRGLRAAALAALRFSFVRGCAPRNRRTQAAPISACPSGEGLSVPLSRPVAPATMLGLASLALRVWTSATGRTLHSGPFAWETRQRDPASRLVMFSSPFCGVHNLSPSPACCHRGAGRGSS